MLYSLNQSSPKNKHGQRWRITERWSVPWSWRAVSTTFIVSKLCYGGMHRVVYEAGRYLGLLELDGAKLILLNQIINATTELGTLFCLINFHQPLPEDLFYWDVKEPFNLQKGWLLWALVGLVSAYCFGGPSRSQPMTDNSNIDSVGRLIPVTGSPKFRLMCLLLATAVIPPLVEEFMYRGFLMASLTKWLSTQDAVVFSAIVFALSHKTQQFSHLFVAGTILGFSYAQTRNLLTPLTIHSLWNLGYYAHNPLPGRR